MKRTHLNICLFTIALILLCSLQMNAQKIKVTNNSQFQRTDEIVQISLYQVPDLDKKNIKKLGVVSAVDRKRLTTQLVDNKLDGSYDFLLFQDSFKPKETKEYELKYFDSPGQSDSKAFVTFVEGREDIAWENDRVAFRMYGPALAAEVNNGIDVWSKSVKYLIVHKWYDEEEKGISSYHQDKGEGADFFSVGTSLGCGGSALMKNDILYQSGVFTSYKIIANGPLRVQFELTYADFSAAGEKVTETKTVILDAGSNLNKIRTSFNLVPADVDFTAGLVKRANISVYTDYQNSIISLWGDNTSKKEDGLVGTAVILPAKGNQKIIEDKQHVLIVNERITDMDQAYYAGTCWNKSGDFKTNEEWIKYLTEFAAKLKSPLQVEINK